MGTPSPRLSDYKLESVTPFQSSDGTRTGWATVRYVKKNPVLTTKGCISTTGSK